MLLPAGTPLFSNLLRETQVSLLLLPKCSRNRLPDGVFNVVQGDKIVVDAILDHSDIAAVSFVGSTPVAKYITHVVQATEKSSGTWGQRITW